MHQTKQYVHLAINYLQQLMALKVRFRAGGGHFAIKLCSMQCGAFQKPEPGITN